MSSLAALDYSKYTLVSMAMRRAVVGLPQHIPASSTSPVLAGTRHSGHETAMEHHPSPATGSTTRLPATFGAVVVRGLKGQCPRCGETGLFRRWLKPVEFCAECKLDVTVQQADDFPAYIAILVTGHVLAPIVIAMVADFDLSPGAIAVILLPSAVALMLAMLQPIKGGVIATQWWNGLHGFRRERR